MANQGDPFAGLELLPVDDEPITPQEELDAAAAGLMEDDPVPVPEDPPEPMGRTWLWDRQAGRFVRDGLSPKEVRGKAALAVWCDATMHTARWAHPIYGAEYGMERPEDVLGESVDVEEYISDWAERLRDALLYHDRIAGVENFDAVYDQDAGTVYIRTLDVITDEEEDEDPVRFGDLSIPTIEGTDG